MQTTMHKPAKAQSAMEYLMTYGWVILIIAVVLAALFELGVFNGSNLAPQACIAQAGFVCKNPIYTSNGIMFTFGQTNGRDYYGDWVLVAAEGAALDSNGVPANFLAGAVPIASSTSNVLIPGQTVPVDFPSTNFQYGSVPSNPAVGTHFAGYVWLGYCLSPCQSPTAYSKIATITVTSVGGGAFGAALSVPWSGSGSGTFTVQSSTVVQGGTDIASATANTMTDGITITDNTLASGIGSVSYNLGLLSPGSYSIRACDTTTSSCSGALPITVTPSSTTTTVSGTTTTTTANTTTTSTTTSSTTTSTTTICTYTNPASYSGDCNVVFNVSTTLTGDVKTNGSITIDSSVTVTSNGYSFIAGGEFDNTGTINSGYVPNSGSTYNAHNDVCNTLNDGESFLDSYGGSGGAGGGSGGTGYQDGGAGGSTLAPGGQCSSLESSGAAGSTPSAPFLSASLIQTWNNNGMQDYMSGGGGGSSGGCNGGFQYGGNSAYGVYIQANQIIAGTINANGQGGDWGYVSGSGGPCSGTTFTGGGGGGGGGLIVLAYGNGGYTSGTYNITGGAGGPAGSGGLPGGIGGPGQYVPYPYGANPPIAP